MTCLAVAIGILGFAAMRRAHRRCHGPYGYGWHGPYGMGGHHGGPFGYGGRHGRKRWMVHAMLSRIDASPAQERAIVGELEKLEERVHGVKRGMHDARADLAAALRGPALDDAALGAVLGRTDAATAEVRAAMLEALRGIHGVLDDRQRAQLADLLDRTGGGGGSWWRGPGPYR
jgi:Spy/CpxP family protein refolding chaperone